MISRAAPTTHPRGDTAVWALGLDIGTTNTKAVALGLSGEPVSLAQDSTPTGDDPADLWARIQPMLRKICAAQSGPPAAVGITSMAESGCLVDTADRPVTGFLRWDRTGPSVGHRFLPDPSARRAHFHRTGVRLSAKTTWSMVQELKYRSPEVFDTARWTGAAEFIHLQLTGRHRTEATLAGRTGLYPLPEPGAEDPAGLSAEFSDSIGLDPRKFPYVTQLPDPCTWEPLRSLPVLVAGHDHAVAAWAVGLRGPGLTVDSVGTSEAVLRIASQPLDRDAVFDRGMSLVRPIEGGSEAVLAGSSSGGGLIRLWQEATDGGDLPSTAADLADTEALEELIAPYPRGRDAPLPDPHARVRTSRGRTLAEVTGHSLLEALALHAEWMTREVTALTGGPDTHRILVGQPLVRNRAWTALKASAAPTRTSLAAMPELTAAGAALLASTRAGQVDPRVTLPVRAVEELPTEVARLYPDALPVFIHFVSASPNPYCPPSPPPLATTPEGTPDDR